MNRIDWSKEEQWVGIPAEPFVLPDGSIEPPTKIADQPPPGAPFVAVGLPSMDFVDTEFNMCFATQMASFRGLTVMLNSQGCYIDEGRQSFVEAAKRRRLQLPDGQIIRPSHLMQFDSDMTFPADTMQRLLSHKVKDVVGCVYSRRVEPFTNIGITKDKSVTRVSEHSQLLEMDLLPTGIMLTHMSVFDRMPEFDEDGPVFGYRWLPEVKKYEREDVRFCRLVRENGMKIWCDVGLSHHIGHVGKAIYMVDEASKRLAAISGAKAARVDGAAVEPSAEQLAAAAEARAGMVDIAKRAVAAE